MEKRPQTAVHNAKKTVGNTKDAAEAQQTEAQVRAKAEAAIASSKASLKPKLQLDPIWRKGNLSADLPAYVQSRSTTMTFPEKVSLRTRHWLSKFAHIL